MTAEGHRFTAALSLIVAACSVDGRHLRPGSDGGDSGDLDGSLGSNDANSSDAPAASGNDAQDVDARTPPLSTKCDGGPRCTPITVARNADFDSDESGWEPTGGALLRWVEVDAEGSKASGALAVKIADVGDLDGPIEGAATQCLPVAPSTVYEYAASIYIKRGQIDAGQAELSVWFYDDEACSGQVHPPLYPLGTCYATNRWIERAGGNTVAPPLGTRSMLFRLGVKKPLRSGPFEILFDAVRVTPYQ